MPYFLILLLLTACTAPNTSAGTAATNAAQTDLRPLPEKDYKLFINNGNPYLKEYQEFFAEQLKRYGKNAKGEPLVNFTELQAFASSHSFLGIYSYMQENTLPPEQTNIIDNGEPPFEEGWPEKYFEDTSLAGEGWPETVTISEQEYDIFLTNINPHRVEFEKFFEEQLAIYGRDDNGERLVNLGYLFDLYIETDVSLHESDSRLYLKIVQHGKTNLHPLIDNGEPPFEEGWPKNEYPSLEEEEPETIPISQKRYNVYVTNINPHRAEFEKFFEEQLAIYGRDDNGERLVNLQYVRKMTDKYGVSIFLFTSGDYPIQKLCIVQHGKTNWYPLPDL